MTTSTLPLDERDAGQTAGAAAQQPAIWTFIDFEGPNHIANALAEAFAHALEPDLGWWADFTIDGVERVIVFSARIFRFRAGDEAANVEARAWGLAHGTPEAQLDWA